MNRARGLAGLSRRNFLAWTAAVGTAGAVGCKHAGTPPATNQTRSQIGEDSADADAVVTVGSKTDVGGVEPLLLSGVGLVSQLPGTGSSPPTGGWRTMLEDSFRKSKHGQMVNVKELLDDPRRTTSLVLVTAQVPVGARRGSLVDVTVALPDESKTTNLQGGVLFPCDLTTTETTGNVHAMAQNGEPAGPSGRLLIGSVWAKAQGPLVGAALTARDGKPAPAALDAEGRVVCRAGVIANGAVVTGNRPYMLVMHDNERRAVVAATIADRLNATFHATSEPNLKVAEAKDGEHVLLNVPAAYRLNHGRFLLVARQVPYSPVRGEAYRQKLVEQLMDPAAALVAALKLEALGGDCATSLRVGLQSPSPWVRFAAAEALAYLGQNDGVPDLARLAEDHPALRVQCLRALASVDDGSGTDRLEEMLSAPDPALRQGAFVALRMADERHRALGGKLMNRSYWLHRVAPDAPAAVHLTSAGRTEVVIYGDVQLRGPLAPLALGSEFTVSVPAGQKPKVARVVTGRDGAEVRDVQCERADLESVLAALARLGGGYSEAVELLRKADRADALTGALVVDAMPRELNVQRLAGFAAVDATVAKADRELSRLGTVNPAVDANGFDLPAAPAVAGAAPAAAAPQPKPPLNRDPGHLFGPLFGPKRAADAPPLDPAVVPAGGQ
jgi:flagellar basal body P-ring protein FlgI